MRTYFASSVMLILTMSISIMLVSCSTSSKYHPPTEPQIQVPDLPLSFRDENTSGRSVLAIYDAIIDPDTKKFMVTPAERTADYHFPLTQLYPNVLQIIGYGWSPNFWADIKLVHPFPGSGINAFDARVIAIIPARPGVSFNYPNLGVNGNNKVLYEPDGYTKLHDSLGGSIPGNVNPFKAYFKNQPYRIWSSTGVTQETQRWHMNLEGFGGSMQYKLVVDVSTNYPSPPSPVIDNAPEPVRISVRMSNDLTPNGGSATIQVTLLDWQGKSTIGGVVVESPYIFNGAVFLNYSHNGPYPNEHIYLGTIYNSLLAREGEYSILVASWDKDTNIFIYQEFPIFVQETFAFNPIDVSPPWLNFSSTSVFFEGEYLYTTNEPSGVFIYNVSDINKPFLLKDINTPGKALDVYSIDGYAYIADGDFGLQIIDTDPPEGASIIKSIDTPGYAQGVYVTAGYAYVADGVFGLHIIDVDPPESASIVKSVYTVNFAKGVYVNDGYAYIADGYAGLQIIDVEPIESASIVKSVDTPGHSYGVYVTGGYAYVADGSSGLQIIDVEPIENSHIVKTVGGHAVGVHVSPGYAYVAGSIDFQIIDISIPTLAQVIKTIDTPGQGRDVYVYNNYAYLADSEAGIQIIDVEWPGIAQIANSIQSAQMSYAFSVSGNFGYTANNNYGLQLIFEPLESAKIINSVKPGGQVWMGSANSLYVSRGYAYYLGSGAYNFNIIDVEPPESANTIKSLNTPGHAKGVYVLDNYAYVADGYNGLQILNINPPENAKIVKSVDTPGFATGVFVSDGYAYIADGEGLQIIDIDPLTSAYLIKFVETPGNAKDVWVYNNVYACVSDGSIGVQIIDINPISLASIIKTVDTPGSASDICVDGNYAYVADGAYGLQIIDIYPPNSAYLVTSVDTPGQAMGVSVSGNYAYIADYNGGLRIIKLW